MTIRVLVADDHKLFRQGLISLIKTQGDLVEVVGQAETGSSAIQMTEKLKPDIVLMDIYMPDLNGMQATKIIKERFPDIAVVMLTSSEDDDHLYESIQAGASGYLLKNLDAAELFKMLEGVASGEAAISRAMAARLFKSMTNRSSEPIDDIEPLTDREIDVLKLVAIGLTNPEIAAQLYISVNTVKTHLKNILSKLDLENRTVAAAYAIKHGIITDEN